MLQENEIRKALQERKKRAVIQRAIQQQDRIRLHCDIALSRDYASTAITDFLNWIKARRIPDKYNKFLGQFRYPVKTVKETRKVFSLLARVFDGQNPVYRYDFTAPEYGDDWHEYRKNDLEAQDKWQSDGMEILKLAINSIVIVDLPKEQTSTLPEPYFYFLDISSVIDYQEDGNHNMLHVIFRVSDTEIVVIDDVSYRVFQTKEKDDLNIQGLLSESKHDLGYCPASFFWRQSLSINDRDVKLSPVSAHLTALDSLLEKSVSVAHLDDYASYPILATYKQDCNYQNETASGFQSCDTGFLRDANNNYIMLADGTIMPCPKCNHGLFAGAGSVLNLPLPGEQSNADPMRNPVQVVSADVATLEYNVKEVERQKTAIIRDITGYVDEPINDQAVNEQQIRAMFETQTRILRDLKKQFEIIIEWTDYTICKLRYGASFMSCSINLGTDFFLYDSERLLELYTDAKTKELDDSILDFLQDQYFVTLYRNNSEALRRQRILNNLEPYRHLTKTKVTALYETGKIIYEMWALKFNFSTFVLRFEREQASLLKFGENLPFDTRINKIQEILLSYGKEQKPVEQPINTGKPVGQS